MADEKEGVNFIRVIGMALLGLALVVAGFMGAQMVTPGQDTEDSPRNWLGTSFGGTVTSYDMGKAIKIKQDDIEFEFELTPETRIVAGKNTPPTIAVGGMVQVRYKEIKDASKSRKLAHTLRLLPSAAGASVTPRASMTPGATGTPGSGTPSGNPTASATQTPATSATP